MPTPPAPPVRPASAQPAASLGPDPLLPAREGSGPRRRFLRQGAGSLALALSLPTSACAAPQGADRRPGTAATGGATPDRRPPPLGGSRPQHAGPLLSPLYPQANSRRDLLSLDGLWDFQADAGDVGEREAWFEALPAPRTIAVPGSWNEQYPDLDGHLGAAWYQRRLEIPALWQGRRLSLRFGSATGTARVWLDGHFLGEHIGGHLPFALDLPSTPDGPQASGLPAAVPGPSAASADAGPVCPPQTRTHTLSVRVDNTPSPTRVPPGAIGPDSGNFPNVAYDFYPYAGLHRQVWLLALPTVAIDAFTVTTARDGGDAVLSFEARTHTPWTGNGRVRIEAPAKTAMPPTRTVTAPAALTLPLSFANGVAQATWRLPHARLWSPADPALHRLRIELLGTDGQPIDVYEDEVGLRTIEVKGDQLLLNGEPLMLRGFGRHEDGPGIGRGLNTVAAVQDLALIRWTGGNSFRTSHYPYSEETLRIADREGLLVIDETPAVGLFFSDSDADIATRLGLVRQQLEAMIARDRNRACVIMWSLANEPMDDGYVAGAMRGKVRGDDRYQRKGRQFFDDLFALARRLDPSRPVTLVTAPFSDPSWDAGADVLCLNRYHGWYDLHGRLEQAEAALARELDAVRARTGKPIILSEFGADAIAGMHAINDSVWTEEYQWQMIRRYLDVAAARPWVIGTHIWNLADFRTAQGLGRPGSLNHKGVFTRDRRPKLAALKLRERWADAH